MDLSTSLWHEIYFGNPRIYRRSLAAAARAKYFRDKQQARPCIYESSLARDLSRRWPLILRRIAYQPTISVFFTGILGFFVSWQFGSTYSWVAQKIDITGRLAPLFFLGCGLGSTIFPPLSGFVFTSSVGAVGILYLTLAAVIVQASVYAGMWSVSRKKVSGIIPLKSMED